MKVAVIGYGNVGMAVFRELQDIGKLTNLTLVGRNMEKMKGEVRDYLDARILRDSPGPFLSFGGYDQTADADIIVYTAGIAKIDGSDRNELLLKNVDITKEIFDQVNRYNKDSIIVCVTNPLDPITTLIQQITGRPASKVIGTGNMLETARLIAVISEYFNISPKSVDALCIGEHGNSSVVLRSYNRVCGMPILDYFKSNMQEDLIPTMESVEEGVRNIAFDIYHAKGYTAYGVAACTAKLIQTITDDSREILPVSTVLSGDYGINGFAISVPCIIGREGRIGIHQIPMDEDEKKRFLASADIIKENCRIAGLIGC